ncbi:MAG TPA: DUF1559 domain-containing protein [Lacipirellulaceae bacterium]|nr:DUF1559 domain-containing protein [Lacipirellulaceae bacterium]
MKSSRSSRSTNAFTLVELLVVIAIIGVLVALLLPAIQSAREAARRSQCMNNLKQIGIGFHNYESANGGFPPRRWSAADQGYTGWGTFILPFMEEQAIYDRYNWKYDFYDPVNKDVVETKLSVFICPSVDRDTPITSGGPVTAGSANPSKGTNYYVNGWIDYLVPNGITVPTNGFGATFPVFSDGTQMHEALQDSANSTGLAEAGSRAPRKLKQITDGLSKTLLVNETAGWPQHWQGRTRLDDFGIPPAVSLSNRGSWAGWQSFAYWTTSGNGVQNASSNPTGGDLISCGINCENEHQIYAFHPGGALILFCDGSVRFVSEQLSGLAFAEIVDIDDGLVINDENLQ